MIDLSRKNIVKVAAESGFIKDNVEKVMRLIDILETVFSSEWGAKLVLKGGTAINLFYMNMPRLSVDIDLDYIGESREEMLADKDALRNSLKNVLFQKGYSISDASKSYFALESYVFQYLNNGGNRDNIKVEINFLDRSHVLPIEAKPISVLGYVGETSIIVLNVYELYGSKFAALLGRSKPRDIYDVYRVINTDLLKDKSLLKKCIIFYNCIGGESDITNGDYSIIEGVTSKDFFRMLNPVLSKKEQFDNKKAVEKLKDYLKELLVFTDNERNFVDDFKNKTYSPQLLFEDDAVLDRIKSHPMALWRCKEK